MLHMCSYYTAHVLLGGLSASHENKASSSTRTGTRLETIASWTILLPNQPQLLGSFGILTHIYICILYIGALFKTTVDDQLYGIILAKAPIY